MQTFLKIFEIRKIVEKEERTTLQSVLKGILPTCSDGALKGEIKGWMWGGGSKS